MLPFTRAQFFDVFASYNTAVWPVQALAYLLGLVALAALARGGRHAGRIVGGVLSLLWAWTGLVYHGLYFSSINRAALLFAALFMLQAVLLVHTAVVHDRLRFARPSTPAAWVGVALVGYALVLYPLIGLWTGHAYPALPMFGITPCPLTLFTFGLLLLTTGAVPWWVLVVPVAWSLIGGSAAFLLGVPQDGVLLASGVLALALLRTRDRRGSVSAQRG